MMATNVTSSGFSANWNASTGAGGYRLDVATDSGFISFVTGYSNRDVGNVTTYPVSGLSPATTYYYRVRAYATNSAGTAYGGEESFTTVAVHTVTFVAGAHGSLTGDLSQTVGYGSDCTAVTAVPDVGYHFTGWTGDYIGGENPLTITNVTADMTVGANFAALPPQHVPTPDLRLSVAAAPQEIDDGFISTGDELAFLIHADNIGDGDATEVCVTVPLPENTEFVSAQVLADNAGRPAPADVTISGHQVVVAAGLLPAGKSLVVELVLRARAGGRVVIAPLVSSAELPQGVPADKPVELEVQDNQYVIVQRRQSVRLCGRIGFFPGLVPLGVWLLQRRRTGRAAWSIHQAGGGAGGFRRECGPEAGARERLGSAQREPG
jgi:uncharacterized repeat protein (TIGR01451 family)